ncbi:hypothetical protein SELMODRAFT_76109, partial [Selaginella moellendorffii]
GNNVLVLEYSCKLVLYSLKQKLWESETTSKGYDNCFLMLQYDGNLVIYSNKKPLWATNKYCRNCILSALFTVQNDCNLVVYSSKFPNTILWASGTFNHKLCSF